MEMGGLLKFNNGVFSLRCQMYQPMCVYDRVQHGLVCVSRSMKLVKMWPMQRYAPDYKVYTIIQSNPIQSSKRGL